MRYQIICTTRNENDSIDKMGFIPEGGDKKFYQYLRNKEEINELIRNGHSFFFTDENEKKVEVLAIEDKYVRTSPDGVKKNNLLHLMFCRI